MSWLNFNTFVNRVALAILIVPVIVLRVQAQVLFPPQSEKLFGSIPEPSMGQYANLWEGITGLTYREQTSTLFMGEQLSDNTFELIAHQAETDPGNGVVSVVGTIEILEQYPYLWLLPYELNYEIDDNPDITHASMTCILEAASVVITASNGFVSDAVAGIVTNIASVTTITGVEETGTFSIFVPLGLIEGPVLAGQIAERIAAMEIYDEDQINPNVDPSRSESGTAPAVVQIPSCTQRCTNAYNTAMDICRNNLRNDLHSCANNTLLVGGGGCATGALLCSFLTPIGQAVCCGIGVLGGAALHLYVCTSNAQYTFDTCQANAFAIFSLCLHNNCGVVIVGPGG